MRKIVLSIFAILMLSFTMSAQNLRITGTVTDDSGQSVMYATVKVIGTNITAYADADGNYAITAPGDATLEFSAQSFATVQEKVNNRTTINVTLPLASTLMEELVVVGYSSARELGAISGSVSNVSEEVIGRNPTANVGDALQGQVPGLSVATSSGDPNASASYVIHGVGSLTAGTSPLVVVDGIPTGLILNTINTADIESITVLRDAAATAIYGSRAANGVIFVTTKKGKKSSTPDARIVYNLQYGISRVARTKTTYMSAQELLDFQLHYGEINQSSYEKLQGDLDTYGPTDWFRYAYEDRPFFSMDLSVSGGSQNTSYYISAGYLDQMGLAPRSSLERYTFRASVDAKIKPWASMGANLGLMFGKSKEPLPSSGSGGANTLHPSWFSVFTPSYLHVHYDEEGNLSPYLGSTEYPNLIYAADKTNNSSDDLVLQGNTYLTINPIQGLNIRSMVGVDGYDSTYFNAVMPSNEFSDLGQVVRQFSRYFMVVNTNTAEYKFNINKQHNISVLAGHEGTFGKRTAFRALKTGLSDDRVLMLSAATGVESDDIEDSFSRFKYLSFFGEGHYNYMDKYFVDLTLRTDGSSRFGENKRFATFWSVGGVWNLKKEDFLKNVSEISSLRVRANYGTQGNSSISEYLTLPSMGISATPYAGHSVTFLSTNPGNPNLMWETSKQFSAGFNVAFWNRLTLDASYFHKKTVDMLYNAPLAYSAGFLSVLQNVAEMTNQGFELEIGATLFQNKDWYVHASTMFTYLTSSIDALYNDIHALGFPNYNTAYVVGMKYGLFYSPQHMGIDPRDGRPMWNDGNGNKTKNFSLARYIADDSKNVYAPYYGGLNLDVAWKGFSLTTSFSYAIGKYAMNNEKFFLTNLNMSGFNRSRDLIDNIWTQPGDVKDYPRYGTEGQFDTSLIENASYLRLKYLMLSYTLPKQLMERTGFLTSVRVYFTARNLFTITPYSGADPEPVSWVLGGQYPNTKQYIGGIELIF